MQHRSSEVSQRVEAIPGIGVVGATANRGDGGGPDYLPVGTRFRGLDRAGAEVGSGPGASRSSRTDLQAGRSLLVGRILVVGVIAAFRRAQDNPWNKLPWLTQLLARRPFKVVAVALANKMARMAWALAGRRWHLSGG